MELIKNYKESFDLIEKYIKNKTIENSIKAQISKLVNKLTNEAKDVILSNICISIYVNNINEAMQKILISNVKFIENKTYLFLIYKLIIERDLQDDLNLEITFYLHKYNKFKYELNELLNPILNLINYTETEKSISINTNKIDALITCEPKKIAKGAQKSVVQTLTGKQKEKIFRVHPSTKDEIVLIEDLKPNYLSLKDKYKTFLCPICKTKIKIDKNDIDKKISVKNNLVQINCDHELNNSNSQELPYSIDLNQYFDQTNTKMEKKMFFINNFKKLVNNEK